MKRILFILMLFTMSFSFGQSWLSKPVASITDKNKCLLLTFTDATTAYIQKQNVSYIVNFGGLYVLLGFMYDGSTSKIIEVDYSAISAPATTSSLVLSDTLNVWLNRP